ncbi:MAG: hypothetical protein M0037_10665 [Betaproteobacteria bacterium]|nr:hypothetical protein [Betaproteobacteria bacterium]
MIQAGISLFVTTLLILAVWKLEIVAYILDIRPTERGIEFLFFRMLRFYSLPFANIEYVEELKDGGFLTHPLAYNCKNRLFAKTFYIKKRKGLFTRQILVTPPDPASFRNFLLRGGVRVLDERA